MIGTKALRFQCIALMLCGTNVAANMSLQVTGHIGKATYLSLCRQGIYFFPLILFLPSKMGILGVEIAQPLSDVFTFITSLVIFISLIKELSGKKDEDIL